MTHTDDGDQGERYEVRATGYPAAEWRVIGWAADVHDADAIAAAVRKHPECQNVEIFDRVRKVSVLTVYAGARR